MKKAIITGSTGMVGKGVLLECLDSEAIEQVLVINRSSLGLQHEKLKEVLLSDFTQVATIEQELHGYDAMYHCMGVSAIGLSEADYTRLTFTVTKELADVLYRLNPSMTFMYVSGSGTDETEKSGTMWRRVKGTTENYILDHGFGDAYMFRPGAIIPEKGIKSKTNWYQYIYILMTPFYPLLKRMNSITTTTRIGQAMINLLFTPSDLKHLENSDINRISANSNLK